MPVRSLEMNRKLTWMGSSPELLAPSAWPIHLAAVLWRKNLEDFHGIRSPKRHSRPVGDGRITGVDIPRFSRGRALFSTKLSATRVATERENKRPRESEGGGSSGAVSIKVFVINRLGKCRRGGRTPMTLRSRDFESYLCVCRPR